MCLNECDVDIWSIDLKVYENCQSELKKVLSSEELSHARKFRFKADRLRYMVSHACCRYILSNYLQIPPQELVFDKEREGKPWVEVPKGTELHFNLTHAGELAYVAVSSQPVGIDIEPVDQTLSYAEITPQFMSDEEQAAFDQLPQLKKPHAFFCCWTRKEAYVKALGYGLSYPIRKITVSLDPEQTGSWIDAYNPVEQKKWQMFTLTVPSGYLGAVVCRGKKLNYFTVDDLFST